MPHSVSTDSGFLFTGQQPANSQIKLNLKVPALDLQFYNLNPYNSKDSSFVWVGIYTVIQ